MDNESNILKPTEGCSTTTPVMLEREKKKLLSRRGSGMTAEQLEQGPLIERVNSMQEFERKWHDLIATFPVTEKYLPSKWSKAAKLTYLKYHEGETREVKASEVMYYFSLGATWSILEDYFCVNRRSLQHVFLDVARIADAKGKLELLEQLKFMANSGSERCAIRLAEWRLGVTDSLREEESDGEEEQVEVTFKVVEDKTTVVEDIMKDMNSLETN